MDKGGMDGQKDGQTEGWMDRQMEGGWVGGWEDGWIRGEWMDRRTDRWMDGRRGWTDGRMDGGEVLGDAWVMPGSCIQKDVPLLLQALEVQEGGRKARSRGSAWAGSWEPGPECCRQHPGAEHSQGVGVGTVLPQP